MVFETKQERRNLDDYAPLVRVDALDRISQFPEHIIHLFLFFTPPKDAARTSALSKTWRQAWNSVRRSDFTFSYDCNRFVLEKHGADFVEEETSKFVKSVDEALLPLREHKTIIQCFRLSMTLFDDKYASCIDNWMDLPNRNHMKTLHLNLTRMERVKRYVLPKTTFSVGSLAELTLKGCRLLVDYFGDNMNKLICLRKLTLLSVEVDDLTVKKILYCCPLLEEFTLSWYMKAEFVHIGYASKLKTAMLYLIKRLKLKPLILNNYTVEDLRVQLENWTWDSFDCNNVKTLCIRLFNFSKQLLQEFNSKFPLLETLDLNFYDDELKISGNGLKSLRLLYCGAKPMLQISFTLEDLSKDLPSSPIANVQQLELGVVPMQDYTDLLDGILRSCHPKFQLIHAQDKEFIKFLGETLLNGDEEAKCCGDSQMKCWTHYLRAV